MSTYGLATCNGLSMTIGSNKIMSHLDANTLIEGIIVDIKDEIVKENINTNILTPTIYKGGVNSTVTLQKTKDICLSIGIPPHNNIVLSVCMFDKVVIWNLYNPFVNAIW